MRRVSVSRKLPGSVHEAETCWYDVGRWQHFIDGLARVIEVTGEWPHAGGTVVWESGPAGRGRVTERAISYQPLAGQTVAVQDDSITAQQTVAFTAEQDEVLVELSLEYEVRKRSPFTPVVDLLFIRGAIERSLRTTISRFEAELAATRQADVG